MHFGIVSLFPEMFAAVTEHGVTGRAVRSGRIALDYWNPRDFTTDKHRTVDDRPYGGGPGMVMMTEPLQKAVTAAKTLMPAAKTIYLSPQGRLLNQQHVAELATQSALILIAGRYEGIDERFIAHHVDEEWSVGDYVLSGGEMAAMVMIDAISRLIPGVLGHELSAEQDSFTTGLLDCPHYTRPEVFDDIPVPPVLLSGNHEEIRRWRLTQSLVRTRSRRPDLFAAHALSDEERKLLAKFDAQTLGSDGSTF
jgi:tRNA (guanine37-N1)-methyltransferase